MLPFCRLQLVDSDKSSPYRQLYGFVCSKFENRTVIGTCELIFILCPNIILSLIVLFDCKLSNAKLQSFN